MSNTNTVPEPTSDTVKSPLEIALQSPLRAAKMHSTPSVSPLSTVSKSQLDSMAANTDAEGIGQRDGTNALDINGDANLDAHDDRSSSLSDIEGSLDDQEEQQVSNHLSAIVDEDNDSEASTERLERTPHKSWRSLGLQTGTERTPSKLNRLASQNDELSDGDDSPADDDTISPSTARKAQMRDFGGVRKRKRSSPLSDRGSSLSEESDSDPLIAEQVRKAPKSTGARKPDNMVASHNEEEAEAGEEAELEDRPLPSREEADVALNLSPSKRGKRRKGAQKTRAKPAAVPLVQTVDKVEHNEDEVQDEEEEDSADAVTAEELEKTAKAARLFNSIAEQFTALRHKLQTDRLAAAEAELAQLLQPSPIHSDYLGMLQCITARRDKKIGQEKRLHHYKKQSLRQEAVGNRSQLLSQYFQEAREIREDILYDLGKQWYSIQKERRSAQVDPKFDRHIYKFGKRKHQIKRQAKYNLEVSVLSGVAKYVGFPAAPEISGAKSAELDSDLKAMQIASKKTSYPARRTNDVSTTVPAVQQTSEHLAQKEFLEQTPWANPQHPVHSKNRTPSAFGYGLGESSKLPGTDMFRPASGLGPGGAASSPFATPMLNNHRRLDREPNPPDSNDNTIGYPSEPPSSVVAAPPTGDRMNLHSFDRSLNDTSPTAQLKRATAGFRAAGGPASATNNHRDFSGLSNASTIDAPIEDSSSASQPHARVVGPSNPNLSTYPAQHQHQHQHYSSSIPGSPTTTITNNNNNRNNTTMSTSSVLAAPPTQAFPTSSLHSYGRQEDRTGLEGNDGRERRYLSDFSRKMGSYGTPVPLGSGGDSTGGPVGGGGVMAKDRR